MGKPLAIIMTPVTLAPQGDSGFITTTAQQIVKVNGVPVATVGSICTMVNSSGVPYPLTICPIGSSGVKILGLQALRMGDVLPVGSGILTIGSITQPIASDSFPP